MKAGLSNEHSHLILQFVGERNCSESAPAALQVLVYNEIQRFRVKTGKTVVVFDTGVHGKCHVNISINGHRWHGTLRGLTFEGTVRPIDRQGAVSFNSTVSFECLVVFLGDWHSLPSTWGKWLSQLGYRLVSFAQLKLQHSDAVIRRFILFWQMRPVKGVKRWNAARSWQIRFFA